VKNIFNKEKKKYRNIIEVLESFESNPNKIRIKLRIKLGFSGNFFLFDFDFTFNHNSFY